MSGELCRLLKGEARVRLTSGHTQEGQDRLDLGHPSSVCPLCG